MEIQITKDENTGRIIEAFVKSETQEGIFYKVGGKIFGREEQWTCTCRGRQYNDSCKHVRAVRQEVGL